MTGVWDSGHPPRLKESRVRQLAEMLEHVPARELYDARVFSIAELRELLRGYREHMGCP